jgi:hypothetical protein
VELDHLASSIIDRVPALTLAQIYSRQAPHLTIFEPDQANGFQLLANSFRNRPALGMRRRYNQRRDAISDCCQMLGCYRIEALRAIFHLMDSAGRLEPIKSAFGLSLAQVLDRLT